MIYRREFFGNDDDNIQLTITWKHLLHPSDEEIDQILDEVQMPRDFLTSALDPYEVPRSETFLTDEGEKLDLFVFLYPIENTTPDNKDRYSVVPLSLVIGRDKIISCSLNETNVFHEAFGDLEESPFFEGFSTYTWFMRVFWSISKKYVDFLADIDSTVSYLEQSVARSTKNEILYQLIGLNKGLIYFKTAIDGNSSILEHLIKQLDNSRLGKRRQAILRDVQVEHHQAQTMIYQSSQMIETLSDMLNNIINNNMNVIMRRLTGWTILLTIPTIMGGLWGMNVPIPWLTGKDGFVLIILVTVVLCWIGFEILKRNRMI